jgi:hypothetical protein
VKALEKFGGVQGAEAGLGGSVDEGNGAGGVELPHEGDFPRAEGTSAVEPDCYGGGWGGHGVFTWDYWTRFSGRGLAGCLQLDRIWRGVEMGYDLPSEQGSANGIFQENVNVQNRKKVDSGGQRSCCNCPW